MNAESEIAKAAWDNYKSGFFKYIERKTKEGAKHYTLLGKIRDTWMKVDWGYVTLKYLEYIRELHGQFRVFGTQGEVQLSELSTDVFLLEQPEFSRYSNSAKRISGLRLVFSDDRGQKLFIWGEPGAGKTTFLKQVIQAVLDKIPEKIPFFITIAEWAQTSSMDYEGLLKYVAVQFKQCGFDDAIPFIDYLIEEGAAILLFDGLDEIRSEIQAPIITFLNTFKKNKSQILVTCRIDATKKEPSGFWGVQVAKWDEPRIKDFISKRIPNPAWREEFNKELNKPFGKLNDIRSNPLLLSLLCSIFTPGKGFPANRAIIFSEATRHLLIERDQEKEEHVSRDEIYEGLTLDQKEQIYTQLAYETFENSDFYFEQDKLEAHIAKILRDILQVDAKQPIDGNVILPKLVSQHGILSRRGHRTYAFAHLAFQEYYTAKYIVENNLFEKLSTNLTDPSWRGVFLLTAEQL